MAAGMSLTTPWCGSRPLDPARVVRKEVRPEATPAQATSSTSSISSANVVAVSPRIEPRLSPTLSPRPLTRSPISQRQTYPVRLPARSVPSDQLPDVPPLRFAKPMTALPPQMVSEQPLKGLDETSQPTPASSAATSVNMPQGIPPEQDDLKGDLGGQEKVTDAPSKAEFLQKSREDRLWNELSGVMKAPMINAPKPKAMTSALKPESETGSGVVPPLATFLPASDQTVTRATRVPSKESLNTLGNAEPTILEQRVARIETMMDERFDTVAAEVAQTTVSLCSDMEQRCARMVESLREDLQKELEDVVGEKVAHFMLKFAPQGMMVPVALPEMQPKAQEPDGSILGLQKSSEVDGMVCMIMDRVVERVKEDECLRKVTAQYEQVKLALDELLSKICTFDAGGPQAGGPGSAELLNMVKSTALDVRRMRQQRNRDYSETVTRFEGLEKHVGAEFQRWVSDEDDEDQVVEDLRGDWPCNAPINSISESEEPQEEQFAQACATSTIAEDSEELRTPLSLHVPRILDPTVINAPLSPS